MEWVGRPPPLPIPDTTHVRRDMRIGWTVSLCVLAFRQTKRRGSSRIPFRQRGGSPSWRGIDRDHLTGLLVTRSALVDWIT
jgi:hypothetical protein